MFDTRILVRGLGVAGSTFAYLALKKGFYVDAVERIYKDSYKKPCGEGIGISLVEKLSFDRDLRELLRSSTRKDISGFVISFCEDAKCRNVKSFAYDFGKTQGYIIDKQMFVNGIRELAYENALNEGEAERYELVVDARGPFSNSKEIYSMPVLQGFAEDGSFAGRFYDDMIHLWIWKDFLGYAWAFPSSRAKGEWNIGIGGIVNSGRFLNERLKSLFPKAYEIKGSKIKVANPDEVLVYEDEKGPGLRIGEAGGFLVAYTGGGIETSIESAILLADSLAETYEETKKRYLGAVKRSDVYHHVKHGLTVFKWLRRLGSERIYRLVMKLAYQNREFYEKFNYVNFIKALLLG